VFKKILAAVSMADDDNKRIVAQAQSMLADGGSLRVLSVVDSRYLQYVFDPTFSAEANKEIERDAIKQAQARLESLVAAMGIASTDAEVVAGHPATCIKTVAEKNHCDLIVMGTHGRRGWRRLLGSVAGEVLHGTPTSVVLCRSSVKEN